MRVGRLPAIGRFRCARRPPAASGSTSAAAPGPTTVGSVRSGAGLEPAGQERASDRRRRDPGDRPPPTRSR